MKLVDQIRVKMVAKLAKEDPYRVSQILIQQGCLDEKAYTLLLDSLFKSQALQETMPTMIDILLSMEDITTEQRERLLKYIFNNPLSRSQAEDCLRQIEKIAEDHRQVLTKDYRAKLLKEIIAMPLPGETISDLSQALIKSGGLQKEQREQLLAYILSRPLSKNQLQSCAQKLAESLAEEKSSLPKEYREALLKSLMPMAVPKEVVPLLTQELIESDGLYKEQREQLLAYILSRPLSKDQLQNCAQKLSECKVAAKSSIHKEYREALLKSLMPMAIPKEVVPLLTQELIESDGLYKEQREQLLKYILSRPLSQKQLEDCMSVFPQAVQKRSIPNLSIITERLYDFQKAVDNLKPWINETKTKWKENQQVALKRVVFDGVSVSEALLDLICEGNYCYLKDARIEFIDREQLWLMMEELLFAEEYFCKYDKDDPLILDCGSNVGLAIYYYKHYYPKARIIGFEPWDVAYHCALRNIEYNNWDDVVVYQMALDQEDGVAEFNFMNENSLAGSLTNRMEEVANRKHWQTQKEKVSTGRLSSFISEPVDFLKMDIEGVELRVLREAQKKLSLVNRMFVEYHYAPDLKENSLTEILNILEQEGFVFQVSRSQAYEQLSQKRPMNKVGTVVSELIWAVKKRK